MNILSKNRKLIIMLVLVVGVYAVIFDEGVTRPVSAAPCIEECEDNVAMCRDDCADSGVCDESSSHQACNSCLGSCSSLYNSCMSSAISCNTGNTYTPTCTVQYGAFCPVIDGQADCTHSSAHNDYFMACQTLGNGNCIRCPTLEFCHGGAGYPACTPGP